MPFVPVVNPDAGSSPEYSAGRGVAPLADNTSASQLGQTGNQLEGQGLRQMNMGAQLQARIQEQMDDANVNAAESKFLQASTDILHGDNGYMNTRGADALNSADAAKQALAKAKKDVEDSLGNDIQKNNFAIKAQRHLVTLGGQMDVHKAQQRKEYIYGEAVAGVESMRVMASQSEIGSQDHKMYGASAIERLGDALRAKGIAPGSEQWLKAERDVKTTLFEDDINRMLSANRYDAAKLYYTEHSSDLDTTSPQMMRIKATIDDSTLANQVQTVVGQVIAKGGTFEEQSQRVDAAFAGNPEGLKEARAEFAHRFTIHQEGLKIAHEENTGKLWDMRFPTLPGQQAVPMSKIVQSKEWASLDGDQRNLLRSQWENYAKRNENDPAEQAQRYLNYFNLVNQRDKDGKLVYPTLSDAQIKSHLGDLGPQLTVQLMKDINDARNAGPAKIEQVTIDRDQLKSLAKDFGIIGDKESDEDKMNLAHLETQMKTLQQNSGQKWSYENTDKLIRQMLTPIVTSRHWYGDTKKPLFNVRVTEQVPQAFIDNIAKKYNSRGVQPPSQAEMYQLWFDAKNTGTVDEKGNPK